MHFLRNFALFRAITLWIVHFLGRRRGKLLIYSFRRPTAFVCFQSIILPWFFVYSLSITILGIQKGMNFLKVFALKLSCVGGGFNDLNGYWMYFLIEWTVCSTCYFCRESTLNHYWNSADYCMRFNTISCISALTNPILNLNGF